LIKIFSQLFQSVTQQPHLRQIANNMGWLMLDKVLRLGVGLVVGVWLARYLGPEQYGTLSFVITLVAIFGSLATMGLQGIVVRDIVRDPSEAGKTLGSAAMLQIGGGLIAFLLLLATIFYLRPDDTLIRAAVAILGSAILFKVSEVAAYWFEAQVQSKYTVWVQNSVFLVFAAIKIGLILSNASLLQFFWAMLAEAIFTALFLIGVFGLKGAPPWTLQASGRRARELLKDSWPLILSSLSIVLYMKVDQIMLGQMLNDSAVGIYAAAVRISEVWLFIAVAINASLKPLLYRRREESQQAFLRGLQRLFDVMVFISLAIAIVTQAFAEQLILTLFGSDYLGAAAILKIHIWAGVFVFLNNALWIWFLAEEKQRLGNIRLVIGLTLNVVLNLFLIPIYGGLGAAVATLISRAFVAYFGLLLSDQTRLLFWMISKSLLSGGLYAFIHRRS
jgi:PST family polysaccharide transporter